MLCRCYTPRTGPVRKALPQWSLCQSVRSVKAVQAVNYRSQHEGRPGNQQNGSVRILFVSPYSHQLCQTFPMPLMRNPHFSTNLAGV